MPEGNTKLVMWACTTETMVVGMSTDGRDSYHIWTWKLSLTGQVSMAVMPWSSARCSWG